MKRTYTTAADRVVLGRIDRAFAWGSDCSAPTLRSADLVRRRCWRLWRALLHVICLQN